MGAPVHGEVSPFQKLSEAFKGGTDLDLLRWFANLNPVPVLLRTLESVENGELKIEDSKYLTDKVLLMKRQYVNAIWPDMERDMRPIQSPILAVAGNQDQDNPPRSMQGWRLWTSVDFELKSVNSGHMEVFTPIKATLAADMIRISNRLR